MVSAGIGEIHGDIGGGQLAAMALHVGAHRHRTGQDVLQPDIQGLARRVGHHALGVDPRGDRLGGLEIFQPVDGEARIRQRDALPV